MDIQIPLSLPLPRLPTPVQESPLALKLNQQIDVKVLSSDILKNSLALQMADKTLQVQVDQAFKASELPAQGTTLKLQVVKLTPTPEFKILNQSLELATKAAITPDNPTVPKTAQQTITHQTQPSPPPPQSLRLILSATQSTATSSPATTATLAPPTTQNTSATPAVTLTEKAINIPPPLVNNTAVKTNLPILPSLSLGNNLTLTPPAELTTLVHTGQLLNVKVIAISTDAIRVQVLNNPAQTPLTPGDKPSPPASIPASIPASNTASSLELTTAVKNTSNTLATTTQPAVSTPQKAVFTVALTQLKIAPDALPLTFNNVTKTVTLPELHLNTGQQLELEVNQIDKQFQFKILNPNQAAEYTQKVTETLRQLLPQQIAPERLLNQLIQQLPALRAHETIPEALHRIAQDIIQNLPKAEQLTQPQILKQAITNSGVFLEAKLPQLLTDPSPELQNDFKLNLLKLGMALKDQLMQPQNEPVLKSIDESKLTQTLNILKELQQKTEGAVAKLVLDQLASLPKEDSPRQIWNIDIPFLNKQKAETIELEIEHDQEQNATHNASPAWSVTLTLTPPHIGTLYCKVIFSENTINTYFRSEHPKTLTMLEAHLETLHQQFTAAGLKTGFLSVQEGAFKKTIQQKIARNNLFNDKA